MPVLPPTVPSVCVVAAEDGMRDPVFLDPCVRTAWDRVVSDATETGCLDVANVSTTMLTYLIEVARCIDADAGSDRPKAVGVGSAPPEASSSASSERLQAKESARGVGDRPPLPSSGHAPERVALVRVTDRTRGHQKLDRQRVIDGLRALLPGRQSGHTPKSTSPSYRDRPVVPCDADVQAVDDWLTVGERNEIPGRRGRRLRRRTAARTPLSPSSSAPGEDTATGLPPKQYFIPAARLYRSGRTTGTKTRISRPAETLGNDDSLIERSSHRAGTKLGVRARRRLQEIYRSVAAVLPAADTTVDLGGGRKAQRYTTLTLDVAIARQDAKAMVDTGAEVSCISAYFLDSRWQALAPYFTPECPIGLRAADGDALQLEGMLHVPIRLGSKSFTQALFVVRNLKDQVLLGLDFLTATRAMIDVSSRTFTFGSEDTRETALLTESAKLVIGAIGTAKPTYLVRAARNTVIFPHQADHVPVELDPPAPPGEYEFTNRHLIMEHAGALPCDGILAVLPTGSPDSAPLHLRVLHGAEEKPLRIAKGQVLSVALPPLYHTSQGNPVFANLGEVKQKLELQPWDDVERPRAGSGRDAQIQFMFTALSDNDTDKMEPIVRDPRVVDGTLTGSALTQELFRAVEAIAAQWQVTVDMAESDMPEIQKLAFMAMVQRKIEAFTPDKEVPGLTDLEELHLNTGTHKPVAIPPRRLPYSQEPMVFAQIQSWLKHGIIRASSSAWSAPVVVVMRNGKFRLAIDYRELNRRLTDEHMNYPLTLIDSCLDVMSGAQFFTTVDISGAFHQIPVAEDSIEKTAFVSKWGQYEFLRAPFGIKSLPGLWSRLADKVLTGLKWQIAAVYMDDIIIFSKTAEDHVRDVEQVLTRIISAGLKIHIGKCKWAQSEVEYVGFIVGRHGVQPMPDKVASIRNFPRPLNLHELRSFLSLASYYRRFIQGFSTLAGPLNELLQKKARWQWGDEHEQAFLALRQALSSPPVLAYPNFNLPYELYTDASNYGLSAILSQRHPHDPGDPPAVVHYASRALRGNEKTYSPTHKEALAIRWGVEKFRPYLYGAKFTIFMDHKALEHIHKAKDSTGQLFRWSLFLQDYDFDIKFRPGKSNINADVLSRTRQAAAQQPVADVSSLTTSHDTKRPDWRAAIRAIRLDDAEAGVPIEVKPQSGWGEVNNGNIDNGDDELEDVGQLMSQPTYIPPWKKQRFWYFLSAAAEMQRQLGGTGRVIHLADPALQPTQRDGGRPADVGAVSATRRKRYAEQPTAGGDPTVETQPESPSVTTHVNAAVDRHTSVPMAREDDDGWSFSVDLLLEQKSDPELVPLRDYIESGAKVLPEGLTEKEEEIFRLAAKAYYIRPTDQILCRIWRSSRGIARSAVFHQVVVPVRLREIVLEAYHDHALGGHTGLGRLYERVMRKYYWPSLLADATAHVKGCDICNKRKTPSRRAVSDWAHRELAWKPFQRISLDFTPMGITTKRGNNSFLLCVDHLTHFVEVWACSNETSEVVLGALTDLTTRYGVPQEIISDNGSPLVAEVVKDLAKNLGAKKSTTAPYRHEANGIAERAIQSFQGMLRHAVEDGNQDEWDDFIDAARFAHNTSYNTSVGECPFFLLYGTDPNVPLDLILHADQPHYANLKDYTARLALRLRKAWAAARAMNDKTRQDRYSKHQAKAPKGFNKFETNARVYVYAAQHKKGLSRKLTAPWSGPYRVIGEHIPGVYIVKPADGKTGQDIRVHASRLKPFVTWAASYVARARHHRRAFLEDPEQPLDTRPPAPRAVGDRNQQPREPSETELALIGKFFEDPAEGAPWRIQAVAWDGETGQMAAYAVRISKPRKGHFTIKHKRGMPMEPIAIEEAQDWVSKSHLLNRSLAPGGY